MGMNIHNILSFRSDMSCFLESARVSLVDRMEFNPFLYLLLSPAIQLLHRMGRISSSEECFAFLGGLILIVNNQNSKSVF